MQSTALKTQPRIESGKRAAQRIRRVGDVPAVLYGRGKQTKALTVNAREVEKVIHTPHGINTVLKLESADGADLALIKHLERHAYKDHLVHIDFIGVNEGEPVRVHIPIKIVGVAPGVSIQNGLMDQMMFKLPVRCMPDKIPMEIEVSVSELNMGQSIHSGDVKLPDGMSLDIPGNRTIVAVVSTRSARLAEVEPGAEGAAAAEGEAAPAEGAAAGKGAAAPAKAAAGGKGAAPSKDKK